MKNLIRYKARVLITDKCNRSCDGCCNKDFAVNNLPTFDVQKCKDFDDIMITGGEPLLVFSRINRFIRKLSKNNFERGKHNLYLYSAFFHEETGFQDFKDLFRYIDGLHFTVHYPATDKDIIGLKNLSKLVRELPPLYSNRLAIDHRVFDDYDFSNIDFKGWHIIRKLKWIANCPLPEGEILYKWGW